MHRFILTVFLVGFFSLALAGCWDQIEIQQRAFVLGLGIDTVKGKLKPAQIRENGVLQPLTGQTCFTVEIPKTSKFTAGGGQQGGGGGGDKGKPAWVFRINGVNLSQVASEIILRTNRQTFLGHLRVILAGESYARRRGFKEVLDFLLRDPEVQREVPIFVVNGKAQDVLAINPPDDPLVSLYIENLMIVQRSNSNFIYLTVGKLASDLHTTGNALIGRIRPANEETVCGGSAVIKNWRFVGFMGKRETAGANMLMNRAITFQFPVKDRDSAWYGMRVTGISRTIRPHWNGKNLTLEYTFKTEGEVAEMPHGDMILNSPEKIGQLERKVEVALTSAANATLVRLQKVYRTDAIGVGEYVHRHWPRIWRRLEPRWETVFPMLPIKVKTQFHLRRSGVAM